MPAALEASPLSTVISLFFDVSAKCILPPTAGDRSPAVALDAATSGNAVNQVQFTYNDFWQSIQTFQEHGGTVNTGTTPSVQRGYANGSTNTVRPLSLTYPNGRELAYDYGTTGEINDALSRIGSIVDDDTTHLVDYEFLGLAGVIQQTSPQPSLRYTLAGVSNDPDTGDIYTGLDRFGRVKDSRWFNTSTNDDLSRIQYGYDRASNRIWRKNPIATAHSAQYDWLYTYDGLQRLKTAHRGTLNGTQTALTSTAFKQDWNLDPTGNWEGFKQSDNGSTWSMEQERTANPVNEITDITNTVGSAWADPAYNAVGNMTTIPKPKQMDEAYTATYDAWNRLVKLEEEVSSTLETVAEYQYDARNFRIVVKAYDSGVLDETTHAYFTDGWQNIEERTDSNSTPSQHHIWGLRYIDDCLLRDRTTSSVLDERLYALQDANWNVTTIVDNSGDVQERFEYDPYGEVQQLDIFFSSSANTNKWIVAYGGSHYDLHTKIYDSRYRCLHFKLGKWTRRDPLRYVDGLSLYERVNQLNTIDPYGLDVVTVDQWWDEWSENLLPWDTLSQWQNKNFQLVKTSIPKGHFINTAKAGCIGVTFCMLGFPGYTLNPSGFELRDGFLPDLQHCYRDPEQARLRMKDMNETKECSKGFGTNIYGTRTEARLIAIVWNNGTPGGAREIAINEKDGKFSLNGKKTWNAILSRPPASAGDYFNFDFFYFNPDDAL
ncbi:hypothetical protein A6X21_01220 [Planctopirus hydrillae]|uniref:Uncharacterized protein n=1 Tax=Planctopirus hydrillae TaxID=1841610 RepID=A0A1C3E4S1_9PLAN|nr:hypothetical protein A6X21_01220 [Planctopirus hydrillae]